MPTHSMGKVEFIYLMLIVVWHRFCSSDFWSVPLLHNIPQREEGKYFSAPHQHAVYFQFHVRNILFLNA